MVSVVFAAAFVVLVAVLNELFLVEVVVIDRPVATGFWVAVREDSALVLV